MWEIDYHTTTSPITCSCLSYHLQQPLLSLAATSPITCSYFTYHLQLPLLSLAAASPITCSCLSYHLQLLLYTGTKLQHILDLLAGNMRRIRF
nr:hypothetical protein [Prevotella sp.]